MGGGNEKLLELGKKKKEGLLSRISLENIILEMAGHWKQGWEYSFLASKATTMHFHKSK